jgi:hypothetical protein
MRRVMKDVVACPTWHEPDTTSAQQCALESSGAEIAAKRRASDRFCRLRLVRHSRPSDFLDRLSATQNVDLVSS